jgi:hypothetical protein
MIYRDLFSELDRQRVEYLLVGGLAVVLHGVPRLTMDVDLLIALRSANVDSFVRAAKALGLTPIIPVQLEQLADADSRSAWIRDKGLLAFALRSPEPSAPTVDVLIGVPIDFDSAYARRVRMELEGIPIWVAAVEDIIAMKENTGRAQDAADVALLRSIGGRS